MSEGVVYPTTSAKLMVCSIVTSIAVLKNSPGFTGVPTGTPSTDISPVTGVVVTSRVASTINTYKPVSCTVSPTLMVLAGITMSAGVV